MEHIQNTQPQELMKMPVVISSTMARDRFNENMMKLQKMEMQYQEPIEPIAPKKPNMNGVI